MASRPCQRPELQQQNLPLPAQRPPEPPSGGQRCNGPFILAGVERELWTHAWAQRQTHADESAVRGAIFWWRDGGVLQPAAGLCLKCW